MAGEPTALGHFRVLDLTQGPGQYATRLLADLGADVIRVEPPSGGEARRAGPFAGDIEDPERSLPFIQFNTSKRSIVLDLDVPADRDALLHAAARSDVVVEDHPPGHLAALGLGYDDLRRVNPGIVVTSVTPFGQTGPRANWKADDLIIQALSDWMFGVGDVNSLPCACPADPSAFIGGAHAAFGTLIALHARGNHGEGQHVDVSLHEAMVASAFSTPIGRYSAATQIMRRFGTATNTPGVNCYQCADGYVVMNVHFDHLWKRLVEWIDHPVLNDPYWLEPGARIESVDVAEEIIKGFAETKKTEDFAREARERGLPVAPVNTFTDVLESPQLAARGWFEEAPHPAIGPMRLPGFPWVLGGTPARIHRPAPLLGEHHQAVLDELASAGKSRGAAGSDGPSPGGLPLAGIRVVDFTRAWAGPFATRLLADYGAEVIKVESGLFDTQRAGRAGTYTELNRNKLSITVDLHKTEGQSLIKRLVAKSDVVFDNYRPGTLERFNLGYDVLKEVNPRIILLSMPGYGSTGPARDFASHGAQLMADSGAYYLWGHPDTPMEMRGRLAMPDFVGGAQAMVAVMAALLFRDASGRGQQIEVAQSEALAAALGVGLLDSLINDRDWQPVGNRLATRAPHNVYPCANSGYCALSCQTDEQWEILCREMARPALPHDPRFATLADRLVNVEELDEIVSEWTRGLTPRQVMHRLQKAGVAAAAVQTGEDVDYDPHLRARGFIVPVDDPESGPMEVGGLTCHLSRTPGRASMSGRPELGGANDYGLDTLLGLSAVERQHLVEIEAIA